MYKSNKIGFFKDDEDRNSVCADRLHEDLGAGVFGRSVSSLRRFLKKEESESACTL